MFVDGDVRQNPHVHLPEVNPTQRHPAHGHRLTAALRVCLIQNAEDILQARTRAPAREGIRIPPIRPADQPLSRENTPRRGARSIHSRPTQGMQSVESRNGPRVRAHPLRHSGVRLQRIAPLHPCIPRGPRDERTGILQLREGFHLHVLHAVAIRGGGIFMQLRMLCQHLRQVAQSGGREVLRGLARSRGRRKVATDGCQSRFQERQVLRGQA